METKKKTLLIVDDNVNLLAELRFLLERMEFEVATATDGQQALDWASKSRPDVIILDILMPILDGREVLRRLRQKDDWTPVILLTQVDTLEERVISFQEGADDYLNKPFEPLELIARIHALLRRIEQNERSLSNYRYLLCGDLVLDRQRRQAKLAGDALYLSARAFAVLEYLMLHSNETISRQRFQDELWGWPCDSGTRAVDIRIAEIRKSLGDDPVAPRYIETVVGQGYHFLGEVTGRA